MQYLKKLVLFLLIYIFPFLTVILYVNILSFLNSPMEAGFGDLGYVVLGFIIYFIAYIIKTISILIFAVISLFHSEQYKKILKFNTVIWGILFTMDCLIYVLCFNNFISLNKINLREDLIFYIIFFSLSATYFPIWVIYGLHNLFCFVKNKLNIDK